LTIIVYAREVKSHTKKNAPNASQDTTQIMKEPIIALLAILDHIYKDLALLIQVIVRNVKKALIPLKDCTKCLFEYYIPKERSLEAQYCTFYLSEKNDNKNRT